MTLSSIRSRDRVRSTTYRKSAERILAATSELMIPYGHLPTTTAIIASANTSSATFYNHFSTLGQAIGCVLVSRLNAIVNHAYPTEVERLDAFVFFAGESQNYTNTVSPLVIQELTSLILSRLTWKDENAQEIALIAILVLLKSYNYANTQVAVSIIAAQLADESHI